MNRYKLSTNRKFNLRDKVLLREDSTSHGIVISLRDNDEFDIGVNWNHWKQGVTDFYNRFQIDHE